jgi:(p)ppGpp synthase/HD superfamily hydrolase
VIHNGEIVRFVLKAHSDQEYGDMPYIVHLMLVARHFTDPTKQAIALLHDTLEDTEVTDAQLFFAFGEDIAKAVITLTKKEGEEYFQYIERIKQDRLATEIKIADLEENIFVSKYKFSWKQNLLSRYEKALKILKGETDVTVE